MKRWGLPQAEPFSPAWQGEMVGVKGEKAFSLLSSGGTIEGEKACLGPTWQQVEKQSEGCRVSNVNGRSNWSCKMSHAFPIEKFWDMRPGERRPRCKSQAV